MKMKVGEKLVIMAFAVDHHDVLDAPLQKLQVLACRTCLVLLVVHLLLLLMLESTQIAGEENLIYFLNDFYMIPIKNKWK